MAPMVGRATELAAVEEVLAGTGRAALVIGEAGVGKTRLVAEAADSERDQGVVVVVGRCLPLSTALPLLPIVDALRALSEVDGGRLWTAILAGTSPSVRQDVARLP